MPTSNPLPPKENALFKRILKCYEHKQYKNGLKFAKQILSNPKFAEHGETLSMKGLTLNCLGKKEEAYENVRRGLRNDLMSHVCWHVYGLLQRSDKKYDEAIKCYRNALKWDKDNIQILRDLSLLQIQMRDLEGYKDTRYHLFKLRPAQRASWIGFAMAYHLLGNCEMALNLLETFQKVSKETGLNYENSEMLLYQCSVMQEMGRLQDALTHLNTYENQICDKFVALETKGHLCLELGKFFEAKEIYTELVRRNPENLSYYKGLERALQLEPNEEMLNLYTKMREKYPRSLIPQRIPLEFTEGAIFRTLAGEYLQEFLRKGVPPLFVNLRSLYTSKEKVAILEELILSYVEALEQEGRFVKGDPATVAPPSALLWSYHYLAQHFDHLHDHDRALQFIDKAISHTPTLIELFMCKGKIYKHMGDVFEAQRWMEEAQELDTADRYVNSKCAKYMLRAGMVKEAEEMCSKFTREGVPAMENLHEMQCMWLQAECALAYRRLGQWGEALKKCHEIDRHFTEIVEDQFDFHTYCLRKMTLRSYVQLLRLEDLLRSHSFYFKVATCAIDVYLHLYDHPELLESQSKEAGVEDTETLSPAELKKLRSKERKARKKAELEKQKIVQAQEKREQQQARAKHSTDPDGEVPRNDDLVPDKLARVEDPLAQAVRFLQPLQNLSSNTIDTHLKAFEIYYRRGKLLLMLQSLKRAWKLDSNHPLLHTQLISFVQLVEESLLKSDSIDDPAPSTEDKEAVAVENDAGGNEETGEGGEKASERSLSEAMAQVLKLELGKILLREDYDVGELNRDFLIRNKDSLPHVHQGAKVMVRLDSSRCGEAMDMIKRIEFTDGVDIKNCTDVLKSLESGIFKASPSDIEECRESCLKLFPRAVVFRPAPSPDEMPSSQKQVAPPPVGGGIKGDSCCSDQEDAKDSDREVAKLANAVSIVSLKSSAAVPPVTVKVPAVSVENHVNNVGSCDDGHVSE